ncbi:MAG: NAD-dependent epimerase/dehydratase family protein, partial [Nitrospinota bacterium]
NLEGLRGEAAFEFVEGDLVGTDLAGLLRGVDWVFHQAAQAGVRASWGRRFRTYTDNNVLGTQRLLEAVREAAAGGGKVRRVVCASSSSIYGDAEEARTPEDTLPRPISPDGVTKLAAEQLGYLYWKQFGVPVVSLRYFTVYGPRQRPDMAFHRFIEALLDDAPIEVYGDGAQTRDFTFVSDAAAANLAAAEAGSDGTVYNIGGGERASINRVVQILEEVSGRKARRRALERQAGDVRHTWADVSRARRELGFSPRVGLIEGIRRQYEWQLRRRSNGHQQRAT